MDRPIICEAIDLGRLRIPHPDQAEIDRQSAELLMRNRPSLAFVQSRCCAQCWGPVVLRCIEDEWRIVCPKGCQPGGHVSAGYVEYRLAQDAIDAAKVAANYPELNPYKPTPGEREANRRALFGEEE